MSSSVDTIDNRIAKAFFTLLEAKQIRNTPLPDKRKPGSPKDRKAINRAINQFRNYSLVRKAASGDEHDWSAKGDDELHRDFLLDERFNVKSVKKSATELDIRPFCEELIEWLSEHTSSLGADHTREAKAYETLCVRLKTWCLDQEEFDTIPLKEEGLSGDGPPQRSNKHAMAHIYHLMDICRISWKWTHRESEDRRVYREIYKGANNAFFLLDERGGIPMRKLPERLEEEGIEVGENKVAAKKTKAYAEAIRYDAKDLINVTIVWAKEYAIDKSIGRDLRAKLQRFARNLEQLRDEGYWGEKNL